MSASLELGPNLPPCFFNIRSPRTSSFSWNRKNSVYVPPHLTRRVIEMYEYEHNKDLLGKTVQTLVEMVREHIPRPSLPSLWLETLRSWLQWGEPTVLPHASAEADGCGRFVTMSKSHRPNVDRYICCFANLHFPGCSFVHLCVPISPELIK